MDAGSEFEVVTLKDVLNLGARKACPNLELVSAVETAQAAGGQVERRRRE